MGLAVKLKRIEKGYKQIQLAEKIGVSRFYLSGLENGKVKNPSIEVMKKISSILETPVETLFFQD